MSQYNSGNPPAQDAFNSRLVVVERKTRPPENPSGRFRLEKHVDIAEHRSGWGYCVRALKRFHNNNGTFLDDFVEQRFAWDFQSAVDTGLIPYTEPWVGFMHNPPNMPVWFEYCSSPQIILERELMRVSLKRCRGLFVFSDYHKRWLEKHVDVPVETVTHPTDCSVPSFTMDNYRANPRKKIIQVGYWLRRMHSIRHLDTPGFMKLWIVPSEFALQCRERESKTMDVFTAEGDDYIGQYEEWAWLKNDTYDTLLARNVVFLHFYDVSAANGLLECIARNTPIVVNPLPAVVEYLGKDYPLYFEDINEAAEKVNDADKVAAAHEYLRGMDKRRFSIEHFSRTIEESDIYASLEQSGREPVVRDLKAPLKLA